MRETEEEAQGQDACALLAVLPPVDSEAFVRRHVAGGAASPDTVTGYLREARLFRDRFLVPRGLAIRRTDRRRRPRVPARAGRGGPAPHDESR